MNGAGQEMYLVECNPDQVLVSSLTSVSRKRIRHMGGKSELIKAFCVHYSNSKGMVDDDPNSVQPPQLRDLQQGEDLSDYGLKVLHQASRSNLLIILCPRLEEWLLAAAGETAMDPVNLGLSSDPASLHRQINFRLSSFERFVKELQVESERVKRLGDLLMNGY